MNLEVYLYVTLATVLISLLGLTGKLVLGFKKNILDKLLIYFVAFSAGSLLGGAFFHLLPEALEALPATQALGLTSLGLVIFLVIESYFHWHHCQDCPDHPLTYTMLIGDAVHNFLDGLIIAASFSASIKLGIVTTLVIMLHELPQELGIFGSLLYAGQKQKQALYKSMLAQSTIILGGLTGILLSTSIHTLSTYLLALAAGGFIYISASDLVPEVHKAHGARNWRSILTLATLIAGLLFTYGLTFLV
jgi:zinc and cadmium transporter